MPDSAAVPAPASTAIGVARPSAQGQAITRMLTVTTIAWFSRGSGPSSSQVAPASKAMATTTGTNIPDTRSASRPIGGFAPWACRTSATIRANAVCRPTAVARNRNVPERLMVPPVTRSPDDFSTGSGSPVSIDSSTLE